MIPCPQLREPKNQGQWCLPIVPAARETKQEDHLRPGVPGHHEQQSETLTPPIPPKAKTAQIPKLGLLEHFLKRNMCLFNN
jgi:hypothetical protein